MGKAISGAAALAAALSFFLPGMTRPAVGQDNGQPLRLGQVEIVGNSRLKNDYIIAEGGLRIGEPIFVTDIRRAVRRLFATGNFEDITPYITETDSNRVSLKLEIKERPFISAIEFQGLESIKQSAVLDTIVLKPGGPLRPTKLAEAQDMTKRLLADKGFQMKDFKHHLEPVPGRAGEHRLIFVVEEGSRVALAQIEFEGNTVFSDDALRKALETKPEGFLWFRSGTFDEERVRDDMREKLPGYYNSEGYLDFSVVGDSLVVDPETGKARLIIMVEEGPQYKLADFEIRGNRRFPTEDLRRYFEEESSGGFFGISFGRGRSTLRDDSVFNATAFVAASQRIRQLYTNQGYLYAQIEPNIEKIEGKNLVRASWVIQEGDPAYISKVTILGNTFTHEDVIRQQLLTLPGDIYSEELLIQSYQRIGALGFFETPMPTPRIDSNQQTGDVDIIFEVKEKQTGSVNFGTAVGGGTGLAGFLGYDQPNLFGQAKSGHLRWEFGRYSNNFEASYSDPAILDTRFGGSLSLFSSRDRFFRFSEGQRRRTGVSARVGMTLPRDVRSRFSVGYTLARTTYEDFEEDETSTLFSLPPGLQSTVTFALTRQTLDHPIFPTSGTRQEIEANFNGGILGGNGDFQKYLVSGNWYVPVGQLGGSRPGSRPIRMTLGLTAESGALFGNADRFPFERFFMGGVQFGKPLRGYDETTITPRGYFPRNAESVPLEARLGDAFLRLSAEYAIRFNDNLSVSTFYDAGAVFRGPGDFNPTRLFRGAGVGVMLVTPFGPIGLDYAYGFDKDRPGWQLHFKFGQGF
ncbi:MAG: outer membrane protein assembly factor BamA [Longimicrobiales bacterium]